MLESENKGYKGVIQNPRNNGKFASKHKEPMVNLTVRLPRSTMDWVEAQAKLKGLNKSDIIREMVQQQKIQQAASA